MTALAAVLGATATLAQQTDPRRRAVTDGGAVVAGRVSFRGITATEPLGDSYFRVVMAEAVELRPANWVRSPSEQAHLMRDILARHPLYPVAVLAVSATAWSDSRVAVIVRPVTTDARRLMAHDFAAVLEGAGLDDGGRYGLQVRTLERLRASDIPTTAAELSAAVEEAQTAAERDDPGLLDRAGDVATFGAELAQTLVVLLALGLLAFILWQL